MNIKGIAARKDTTNRSPVQNQVHHSIISLLGSANIKRTKMFRKNEIKKTHTCCMQLLGKFST